MTQLEDDIKNAVTFNKISATGFHSLKCPVCGDKKERAGFQFSDEKIVYNCFRGSCDAPCEYVYGEYMSNRFKHLMEVIGVQLDLKVTIENKKKKVDIKSKINTDIYEKHSYKTIRPFRSFDDYVPDKQWWFREFLKDRHADFHRKLYIGTAEPHKNQLIIPFFYETHLIGWQGLSVNSNGSTFYQTSSDNTDLIFINNQRGEVVQNPIIVEGIMDAVVIPNAIATLGNKVSKKQAWFLRNSSPILLPDRKDSKFIETAKRYGWKLSIPSWKEKDVNAVVQRYGKLVAAKMIHDGIQKNMMTAETKYKMWRTR
jgi:hypothetical protein